MWCNQDRIFESQVSSTQSAAFPESHYFSDE